MPGKEKELDYKIFKELKEAAAYLPAQKLAGKLKISRQCLREHIKNLTASGCRIKLVSGSGYKLNNSHRELCPWEISYNLGTKFIGRKIYFKEVLSSTQDSIFDFGQSGAPEGVVVIAGRQKKGRGRRGRKWISPRGGLYLSCLLRPQSVSLKNISQASLVISLACIKAIAKHTGINPSLKWPNDIFLAGKKLGGVLCQVNTTAGKINFLAAGIGININTRVLPPAAVSLALYAKKKFSRAILAKEILRQVERFYLELEKGNSRPLLEEWQKHCFLWGRRLRLKILDETIEGEAVGIDRSGRLLLRRDTGLTDSIASADTIETTCL